MQIFDTIIKKDDSSRFTCIAIPFDAKKRFKRPKGTILVKGTINDVPFRSKLLSRGFGNHIMLLNKALQKKIGFTGDYLPAHVTMALDGVSEKKSGAKPDLAQCHVDAVTAICSRRSIRKFSSEPISDTALDTILYAGLCAPSAKDMRPYHFVVIKDRDSLSELSRSNPNAYMLPDAACAIVICGDRNTESIREFLLADCSAAAQNILLCAHGLSLGAVWCGVVANSTWSKLIARKLSLPMKVEPVAVIALGHTLKGKPASDNWDAGKIHDERW